MEAGLIWLISPPCRPQNIFQTLARLPDASPAGAGDEKSREGRMHVQTLFGVPVLVRCSRFDEKIKQIVREIKGYLFGEEARGRGETLF